MIKKIPVVDELWVCPVCLKRHGLKDVVINNGMFNKNFYIKCSNCETEFEPVFKNGRVVSLKVKTEGVRRSPSFVAGNVYDIENLRDQFISNLELEELNIKTPFILMKDEKVFFCDNIDRKSFVKKTESVAVKNKKPVSLFSMFSTRNYQSNIQNYQQIQQTTEVFEKVDSGNFIITNKRIAFAGRKLTVSIELDNILSIYLDENNDIVIGTNDGQLFLDSDKPIKNEIIDIIKFLRN